MKAISWGGKVDGGRYRTRINWRVGRWILHVGTQDCGDAYGEIGAHGWQITFRLVRNPA